MDSIALRQTRSGRLDLTSSEYTTITTNCNTTNNTNDDTTTTTTTTTITTTTTTTTNTATTTTTTNHDNNNINNNHNNDNHVRIEFLRTGRTPTIFSLRSAWRHVGAAAQKRESTKTNILFA